MVKYIKSDAEWDALMAESSSKLVVVDFTASWCGPCNMIAPHFEAFSNKYTNAIFVKVDVDENDKLAQKCGIRAMPTFHFYKNGTKVDELMGANINALEQKVQTLS